MRPRLQRRKRRQPPRRPLLRRITPLWRQQLLQKAPLQRPALSRKRWQMAQLRPKPNSWLPTQATDPELLDGRRASQMQPFGHLASPYRPVLSVSNRSESC